MISHISTSTRISKFDIRFSRERRICTNQNLVQRKRRGHSDIILYRVYTEFWNEWWMAANGGKERKRSLTFVCTFVRHLAGALSPALQIPANWNISRSLMFPVNNKPSRGSHFVHSNTDRTVSFRVCFSLESIILSWQTAELA